MTEYFGRVDNNGRITHVTDDVACYDLDNAKCYCAQCYHDGPDLVNCRDAAYTHAGLDNYKPVHWDGHCWTLN